MTNEKRRWYQFDLRRMFLFVFAVAFAIACRDKVWFDWGDWGVSATVIAFVSVWLVAGLAMETYDIWRYAHAKNRLASLTQADLRFALAWRSSVILLMAAVYVTGWIVNLTDLERPWGEIRGWYDYFLTHVTSLVPIFLLLAAGLPPPAIRRPSQAVWAWSARSLMALLLVSLFVVTLVDQTIVFWLTFASAFGMEADAPPIQYTYGDLEGVDPDMAARYLRFFRVACVFTFLLIANYGYLYGLVRFWTRGVGIRSVWFAAVATATALQAWFAVWVWRDGIHQVSPQMTSAMRPPALAECGLMFLLVAVVSGYAAFRLTTSRDRASVIEARHSTAYFHRSPIVSGLLLTALVVGVTLELGFFAWEYRDWPIRLGLFRDFGYVFTVMLPTLWLPLVLLAIAGLWRHFRSDGGFREQVEIRHVNLTQFFTVWLAAAATLCVTATTGAAFAFGMWAVAW